MPVYSGPIPVTIESSDNPDGGLTVSTPAIAPIAGKSPGIRQTIATANQDVAIPIPAGAVGRGV